MNDFQWPIHNSHRIKENRDAKNVQSKFLYIKYISDNDTSPMELLSKDTNF